MPSRTIQPNGKILMAMVLVIQKGNNPDPFLFDFDNDGYNDSIEPNLPALGIWTMTVSWMRMTCSLKISENGQITMATGSATTQTPTMTMTVGWMRMN